METGRSSGPSSSGASTSCSTSWRTAGPRPRSTTWRRIHGPERWTENPARALAIEITESASSAETPRTGYRGRYYSVADTVWDRTAFRLLYQGFQMTVTDVSHVGVPITISK